GARAAPPLPAGRAPAGGGGEGRGAAVARARAGGVPVPLRPQPTARPAVGGAGQAVAGADPGSRARKRKLEPAPGADRRDRHRLLDAAKADHWDDGPRLALADWLEEHGGEAERARAEVIRLQLDTAGGGPDWSASVRRLREKWVGE